jgi:SAM-dependent methyltransferase
MSFYRRRIYIPVSKDALVLDVGSGDKPHWRADILLDRYIDDKYGVQRSGSITVITDRPIFNADVEDMPFQDKVFDYVVCSHLLEHVVDPQAAIEEIIRVGKAGYIELPYVGYQKIIDYCSHLWFCDLREDRLILTAKSGAYFDDDIERLIKKPAVTGAVQKALRRTTDDYIIKLYWHDTINFEVNGIADEDLINAISKNNTEHNALSFVLRNIANKTMSAVLHYKKRRAKILFNSTVKSQYSLQNDEYLEKRIYHINERF